MKWQLTPTPSLPPPSVGKRVTIYWLAELVKILVMFTGYLPEVLGGDLACLSVVY